ncbi:AAA family ATPase, partial [Candidatus Saccharibacteria bacterium]|nr:AAA family ATPase [Candidatus Saccharibacteria bacterium]
MIERTEYLEKLKSFRDKDLIKVITGIRRCGKSTLFDIFIDYLLKNGVKKEQIIKVNLENPELELPTHKDLYNYVKEQLPKGKKAYVFL